MGNYNQLINSMNWHSPSWDLFIFLFWIAASVIYAFAAGRGRIINILICVYMAKLLVYEAPFISHALTDRFNFSLVYLQQLVTFVILFLLLFLFMGRYVFRTSADSKHFGSIIFGLIFSVLQIGLLINIILNYLPQELTNNFSQLVRTLFLSQSATFVWLVVPLVYLIFLGKFVSDVNEV